MEKSQWNKVKVQEREVSFSNLCVNPSVWQSQQQDAAVAVGMEGTCLEL